ncbi:MAG: PLP-dependent aminotransferase family protein [Eubacteriales bacterium]
MKYIIQKNASSPAYIQLYRLVRDDIVAGVYPYNTKLPSKRTVAHEIGVSTITVEHAYALLCDEGYVESKERSGFFVIFRTDDGFAVPSDRRIKRTARAHSDTYAEFPFSTLTKAMRATITEMGESILERSPNRGCTELREAIRQHLARNRGIFCDAEQIIVGAGSEYLYTLIVELLGRDRVYGIESPSYKKIEEVYRASDAKCELLTLEHDGISSKALWASGADVLHITPYRSFPSGITASASKRHEYLRWASTENRYIVEDDFESEFSISQKPEETLFGSSQGGNVIYMNTFSKTVSPSLRVGYMILPRGLVPLFEEKLGFYSCTVPTYMQYVLAKLISNGDFERHINRVRRQKRSQLFTKK